VGTGGLGHEGLLDPGPTQSGRGVKGYLRLGFRLISGQQKAHGEYRSSSRIGKAFGVCSFANRESSPPRLPWISVFLGQAYLAGLQDGVLSGCKERLEAKTSKRNTRGGYVGGGGRNVPQRRAPFYLVSCQSEKLNNEPMSRVTRGLPRAKNILNRPPTGESFKSGG